MSFINFAICLSLFGLIIFGADQISRIFKKDFYIRKVAHILCGLLSASMPLFLSIEWGILVAVSLLIFASLSWYLKIFTRVDKTEKENFGTIIFPFGMLINIPLFWSMNPLIFSISMLILGFSDAFAAIIGRRFGKHQYQIIDKKTFEGSFVFALTTISIFTIFFFANPAIFGSISIVKFLIISLGSIFITFVEGASAKGWDNLFIPFTASFILFLLINT